MLCMLAALAVVPLQYRWFYVQTNLFREEEVGHIEALLQRAAKVGYNGMVITDTKIESLDPYPDFYRKRVQTIKDEAKRLHIEVIPVALSVGYADAMLAHNPNLVEAAPVKDAPFVVHGGVLQIATDPDVRFDNGDFETAQGDKFSGFAFQDGIGIGTFADHQTVHGGKTSLRIENPGALKETSGNCRIMRRVKVRPWRHYNLSAWVKTQDFASASSVRVMALNKDGKAMSFHDVSVTPTADWKRVDVTFDTRENEEALLYLGVWGGTTGKMWFDDAKLEELGLTNVVRRPGCPVKVVTASGRVLREGEDYEPIADPKSGTIPWKGEFEITHPSPPIVLTKSSPLREGDRVKVSWFHAVMTETGKTAICLSEPETRKLEEAELRRVAELFGPERIFYAHDEIRVMNLCDACTRRGISPGKILNDDILFANSVSKSLAPKCERYIWSDMIDPYHNAVPNYYAVNGDLTGSWEGLPKDLIVVNWNSGQAEKSLPFFDKLGHRQILAGYYDGPVGAIKGWLAKGRGLGIVGVMYTTWVGKYDDLEAFAKAAW
ncbi:hypothetical protein [Fimbriimonas ginsengisoli]|uniref:CBM-cenC domain-containing protein n=1 Tax=Fimbriimonas ginsengisoli Gsoil 348 TaxID=661478 RepID=A0A068NV04_FIMGI|nr:hypothetical protein [Fimbriimonas ginsengisoli]AIE86565.1 hypothetical protein OP10G_3197 [Fimbriimonas ginsengisoli Gsoil 348]